MPFLDRHNMCGLTTVDFPPAKLANFRRTFVSRLLCTLTIDSPRKLQTFRGKYLRRFAFFRECEDPQNGIADFLLKRLISLKNDMQNQGREGGGVWVCAWGVGETHHYSFSVSKLFGNTNAVYGSKLRQIGGEDGASLSFKCRAIWETQSRSSERVFKSVILQRSGKFRCLSYHCRSSLPPSLSAKHIYY